MPYDFLTVVDRSGTGSSKWDEMRRAVPDIGPGCIPLSIGDMELVTPPGIVDGLKQYLDSTVLGYTNETPQYRESVAGWMTRRHGWSPDSDWIIPGDGVVPVLYNAVACLTRPGSSIIYMPPIYPPIVSAIKDNDRNPAPVPLHEHHGSYSIDFDAFAAAAARPETEMFILCSPHNPTSRVWRLDELEKIAAICLENGILVVSDEIHMDFAMSGHKHHIFPSISAEIAEQSVLCTAPSKTFNIAGLQICNTVIPNASLRRRFLAGIAASGRYGPNQLGLAACQIAYSRCEKWLDAAVEHIESNGRMVAAFIGTHLPEVVTSPHQGSYFQWLDFRAWGLTAEELEARMHRAGLFFDEGKKFGELGRGWERINLACPRSVIQNALEKLISAKPS